MPQSSSNPELTLMHDLVSLGNEVILDAHRGDLRFQQKKYTQLRLMGMEHAVFKDLLTVLENDGSARTAELLLRPLIEIFINFRWIGLGSGNKNCNLYAIDDSQKMIKHIDRIITHEKNHGNNTDEINAWQDVRRIHVKHIEKRINSTKGLTGREKYPTIAEKAKQIDTVEPNLGGAFEWITLFPYFFAHRAVHVSNSQLDKMISEDDGYLSINGSDIELRRAAFDGTTAYLGMLEDYTSIFKIKIDADLYWQRLNLIK